MHKNKTLALMVDSAPLHYSFGSLCMDTLHTTFVMETLVVLGLCFCYFSIYKT